MAKEVNFGENQTPQGQRLSSEQLQNVLNQVGAQNEQLRKQNTQLIEQLEAYRKNEFYLILDWNYKIVESDSPYFSAEFKRNCAARVENMMTPQKQNEEETKEEEES